MEGSLSGHKRCREDGEASPEAKRLQADLLQNILSEDDTDAVECDPADVELATVIKSLEEEIAVSPTTVPYEIYGVDIEYLQEASDDELGIPPPIAEDSSVGDGGEFEFEDEFGQIWGYEDDVLPEWYEGMTEFGFLTEWDSRGVIEGGGASVLFDGDDLDVNDLAWRPSSLSLL